MLELQNEQIHLAVREDGLSTVVTDRPRGGSWEFGGPLIAYGEDVGMKAEARRPLGPGRAARRGDVLIVSYALPGGEARVTYALGPDHLEVTLLVTDPGVSAITAPGLVRAAPGEELLVPRYQGTVVRSRGQPFLSLVPQGSHSGYSLAMQAVLGARGGLLITQESPVNWRGFFGEDEGGRLVAGFEQFRCEVHGWYERRLRLYPAPAGLTATARRFRERVRERGELKTWEEKIAERPMVARLFGALMAFTGYNATTALDYVAEARKLRAFGFDSVLYYPVRFCQRTLNFKMGGDDPVWLTDDQLAAVKNLGGLVAPWAWEIEWLDDGSEECRRALVRRADGSLWPGWRIEQQQWYLVCPPYQMAQLQQRFATDMSLMDWVHHDVNACTQGRPCHSRDHERHGHAPIGLREGLEWCRKIVGPETNGNRIVSSEGFAGWYAAAYDIGSVKVLPSWNTRFVPVPLTGLVHHDSCMHDWWEVHNYNELPYTFGTDNGEGLRNGCGYPEKKAAMDALYGVAPNVFPFGKQYYWTNVEKRETASFLIRFEDAAVQRALRAALPVTRLHRRIGRLDLQAFAFVTDDRAVQMTTFADGTRVVANVADEPRDSAYGTLPANSWREVVSP